MHPLGKAALGLCAFGAAGLAYSAGYEVRAFRLREVEIPCLPADAEPIRALHLSDIHITPSQAAKAAWLRSLAALEPDLLINTGDSLSHHDSVPVVMEALGGLRDVPGV
jgi:predicted MPP superfamily phosphohydrolase